MLYALSKSISIRSEQQKKIWLQIGLSSLLNLNMRERKCPQKARQCQDSETNFIPKNRQIAKRKENYHTKSSEEIKGEFFFRENKKKRQKERIDDTRLTIKIVQHSFFLFSPEKIPSSHFKFHERESWSSSILLHYIQLLLRLRETFSDFAFFLVCKEKSSSSAGKLS